MAGHFTEDSKWGPGRPCIDIPPALVEILEATYHDGKDYVITGKETSGDVQDIIRYGRIHARHRQLSFRYYFFQGDDNRWRMRFRMTDKRPYVKKNPDFWNGTT